MNIYIDMDVAVDHQRKVYQVQLHTILNFDGEDLTELTTQYTLDSVPLDMLEYSTVPDFRKFTETLNYIRQLIVNGYTPVGKGTMYPEIVLPSKALNVLKEWM
jgi:hypothetical protein